MLDFYLPRVRFLGLKNYLKSAIKVHFINDLLKYVLIIILL